MILQVPSVEEKSHSEKRTVEVAHSLSALSLFAPVRTYFNNPQQQQVTTTSTETPTHTTHSHTSTSHSAHTPNSHTSASTSTPHNHHIHHTTPVSLLDRGHFFPDNDPSLFSPPLTTHTYTYSNSIASSSADSAENHNLIIAGGSRKSSTTNNINNNNSININSNNNSNNSSFTNNNSSISSNSSKHSSIDRAAAAAAASGTITSSFAAPSYPSSYSTTTAAVVASGSGIGLGPALLASKPLSGPQSASRRGGRPFPMAAAASRRLVNSRSRSKSAHFSPQKPHSRRGSRSSEVESVVGDSPSLSPTGFPLYPSLPLQPSKDVEKTIAAQVEDFLSFPFRYQGSFSILTLLRFLPVPIAPICHERRIDQVFLLTNKEAKGGLINEMSTHIIIDCLFLTITASPIYNKQLEMNNRLQRLLAILFYLTFNLQLLTILLNGILIFSLIEVPTYLIRTWGLARKHCFLIVARMHVLGMYCFLGCSMLWPLASYPFPESMTTFCAGLLPWVVTLFFIGSTAHPGLFDLLSPNIKLQVCPSDLRIRKLAMEEVELLRKDNPDLQRSLAESPPPPLTKTHSHDSTTSLTLPPAGHLIHKANTDEDHDSSSRSDRTLVQFLSELELLDLLTAFEEQNIILEMLPFLENSDFKDLGISIGDRVVIQQAISEEFGQK